MRTLLLFLCAFVVSAGLTFTPFRSDADPPSGLGGGAILSLTVFGGRGGIDRTTTFFNNGDFTIDDRVQARFCEGISSRAESRDLREARRLLRADAQNDAVFGSLVCCDMFTYIVTTPHGTVTWYANAVFPIDVQDAIDLIDGVDISGAICGPA